MKIVTVSGTMGGGKTTLIRELIGRVGSAGKRSAVIVNEVGEQKYDDEFVRANAVAVTRLEGG
jgi:G3E family GTPase